MVIRQWQKQDNTNCVSHNRGTKLAWIGGSGKTARRKNKQRQDGSDNSDVGDADWTWW